MGEEQVVLHLRNAFFTELEQPLLVFGGITALAFRYRSGVCGLRIRNGRGEIVALPFQGQQIWSAAFEGRRLGMTSVFAEPRDTADYLSTYGGFMLHCGFTAMGRPGPLDDHPVHGELPNAPYQEAYLKVGRDGDGAYMELSGRYRHSVAFTVDYMAEPTIRMYEDGTSVRLSARFTNLRSKPLAYMYLLHLNFRPIDGSRLVGSSPCELHTDIREDSPFDPEVILYLQSAADDEGWAHHMQIRPDGYADFVKHRPDELGHCVRWIIRTGEEQALGLAMPATAEAGGYTAEKEKGNMKYLAGGESVGFQTEAGLLAPNRAERMEEAIKRIIE